jgi:hypothetical protein
VPIIAGRSFHMRVSRGSGIRSSGSHLFQHVPMTRRDTADG